MPRLDHQRHQKGRKGRERAQQQACQHKFQRTAVDHRAHEHGHPHRQAQRLHINAIAHPQHKIARQHRDGLRCGGAQCPPYGALPPCQLLSGCIFHWSSLKKKQHRAFDCSRSAAVKPTYSICRCMYYYSRFHGFCKSSGPAAMETNFCSLTQSKKTPC